MNKKIIAITAAIVIVVSGMGIGYYLSNDNDKVRANDAVGRLVVYGNTDNNDYLDSKDLTLLKKIVNEGTWDKGKNPYADANCDGVVDSQDVTYLEKLLAIKNSKTEKMKMYYVGSTGKNYDISYPITGDYAANMYYGMYDAMALGIYDRVTAGTDRVIGYKEDMFPGCKKLTMVGTNYKFDQELLLKTKVKAILGANSESRYEELKRIDIDVLMVKGSGQTANGIDVISSVITLGVLCSCEKASEEYREFFDRIMDYIKEKASKMNKEYTYVMPYNPKSFVENTVDTEVRSTGAKLGDVYAMSLIPMKDLIYSETASCPVIQTEEIIKMNPDFIVISSVATLSALDDPASVQSMFNERYNYFKETNAFKNGKMFGISYDSIGATFGVGVVPLLCSKLWPEIFSEAEAWDIFKETVDKFTELKYTDIKKCGGIIVYGMGP